MLGLTPDEWADARRIETSYLNQPPGYEEQAAKRLIDDCKKAKFFSRGKPDVAGYLNSYATKNPVGKVKGKDFAFWAFNSSPDASTPPVGSHFQAKACAKTRKYQVLSETPSGERLDSYRLHDRKVLDYLRDNYGIPNRVVMPSRDKAWTELSASMAMAAEGKVRVIAPDVAPGTILAKTELPTLIKNPNVGLDNIKFVTEFPEQPHLPKNLNQFLAHDAVRAQVTMDHYNEHSPGPAALADKLDSINLPSRLHAERDQATAALRSSTSYKDLKARTPTPTPTPPPPPPPPPGTGSKLGKLATGTAKRPGLPFGKGRGAAPTTGHSHGGPSK